MKLTIIGCTGSMSGPDSLLFIKDPSVFSFTQPSFGGE